MCTFTRTIFSSDIPIIYILVSTIKRYVIILIYEFKAYSCIVLNCSLDDSKCVHDRIVQQKRKKMKRKKPGAAIKL